MSILGPRRDRTWSKNLAMSPSMSIAGGTSDINRTRCGEHGLALPR